MTIPVRRSIYDSGEVAVQEYPVFMIKPGQLRTIKIEDAQQPFILDPWNHDFRTRRRVACDVPGKRMNIRNYDRLPALGGSAADPLTHCNPNTGYLVLKGTEQELAPLQK